MLLLTLLLSAPLLPQESQPGAGPKDLVEVQLRSPLEARKLFLLASDPDDHFGVTPDGRAWIYADDAEQDRLAARGFQLQVLQEDLAAWYAARAAQDTRVRGVGGSMGGFRTLAEIEQEMDRLASDHPNLVSPKFALGTTGEGRTIWAMRISDTPGADDPAEPLAWFDALHHAREPMSGESLLLFADHLVTNYGTDAAITRMVNTRNILVVPCMNPDGYEYNRQTNPGGGGFWRKNRRPNGGGQFGVDTNRNYGWEWGSQWNGSSGDPGSETYRGPSAFSEPETQAARDALALHPPGQSVSAHCYSDLWIFPWTYDDLHTPDDADFQFYAAAMTAGNGYSVGNAWETVGYNANGASLDWHYATHGTFAYTPEIGSSSDGFWPAPSRIPALFQDVLPGYLLVTQWSGAWAERTGLSWSQVSGDGDVEIEPGETWDLRLDFRNDGVEAAAVTLALSSPYAEVIVEAGAASASIPVRGAASSTPLRLRFDASAQAGVAYDLDLDLSFEGETDADVVRVLLGRRRVLAHDDMETDDYGWQVSNATNWSWERAIPQGTSSGGQTLQPGTDNPAGTGNQCWVTGAAAGGGAGTNDVDGTTVLTSPVFRAAGFASLRLEYARWFANLAGGPVNDQLVVEVSNNAGLNWTEVERTGHANAWTTMFFDLESVLPLTDAMQLRFTAADDPNDDLTEAALDDLELTTFSALPTLGVWGRVERTGAIKLTVDGPAGRSYAIDYSLRRRASGTAVPGFEGLWYLTGSVRRYRSGVLDASGLAVEAAVIPNKPGLVGRSVYLQATVDSGGAEAALTPLVTLVVL